MTLLDLSYYMAPPVELPPREKRLLHRTCSTAEVLRESSTDPVSLIPSTVAFAKARQTMDDPLYNSEDEEELDDQAVHDLSGFS